MEGEIRNWLRDVLRGLQHAVYRVHGVAARRSRLQRAVKINEYLIKISTGRKRGNHEMPVRVGRHYYRVVEVSVVDDDLIRTIAPKLPSLLTDECSPSGERLCR